MSKPKPGRWAWLLLAAAGCASPKTVAPTPPVVSLDASRAAGSPLAVTTAPADDVAAGDLIGIEVTWLALTKMPADALTPLDAQSSLTSAPLAEGAVLTSGLETRRARFGGGLAAAKLFARWAAQTDGPVAQVGHQTAWVAPGTTVRLRCEADSPRRMASIAVYRPPEAAATGPTTAPATTRPATATFAVSLAGTATTRPADPAAVAAGPETAFVDGLPLSPGTPFALVVPWPAASGPWAALGAYVEVLPSSEAHAADAAAFNTLLAERRRRPAGPATLPGEQLTLRRAIDALKSAPDARPALTYLAATTHARIAADVAIVADATLLNKLRDAVLAAEPADPTAAATDAATNESVGWLLDRTTLLTLADAASKAPLPPEMVAALAVHAGEVGRNPDTLAEITRSVGSAADLHSRLIAENYIALEDNAAAARVRAFDWLRAQGRAPADYDPLGPARDRRRAISRALTAPGGTP